MDPCARTGRALPVALLAVLLSACAGRAFADLTVFAGSVTTTTRPAGGAALGLALQPVGLEFEYAGASPDPVAGKPALQTGLFSLLIGTPFRTGGRIQVYGSMGGGVYRERLSGRARTDLAASGGGGVFLRVAGPLRVRIDYRLFALRGEALHRRPRRAYAGLNVAFRRRNGEGRVGRRPGRPLRQDSEAVGAFTRPGPRDRG